MTDTTDVWDDLQEVIGRGWPHYKDIARPLFGLNSRRKPSRLLLIVVLLVCCNKCAFRTKM